MKALSIRQPWAWLIVNGYKDIENRTWPTRFRGRVLIHAGKSMTRAEYEEAVITARYAGFTGSIPARDQLARGGIVGAATIDACVVPAARSSPWHMGGSFGFHMVAARPIPFVECKGMLQFFDIPADVAIELRQMHELGAIA